MSWEAGVRDFEVVHLDKYQDTANYESIGDGLYRDLSDSDDTNHRVTLSFTSEDGEGQYPIDDLLSEYLTHVSDFVTEAPDEDNPGQRCTLEFAGDLEGVTKMSQLVGKIVRNETFIEGGEEYERLVVS